MKYVSMMVTAVLLGGVILLGCGGSDSHFTISADPNSNGNSNYIDGNSNYSDGNSINYLDGNSISINFISAEPHTLALKGTGGPARSETSDLVFKVVDKYGDTAPNQAVNFELSTEIGGLSLSDPNGVSDASGLVRVTVKSGSMPTHVRVKATLAGSNPLIAVVSDELLVSTGLPDQDSISLGAVTLNPEAWHYNNEKVEIIFQAADHFNNFVPDGTVVYFSTEGGSIDDSCVLQDGVCEVTWRSGEPRPDNGRITILAFCIGEESFKDENGNAIFEPQADPNDQFITSTDVAEPFRDDNENGIRDPLEPYWDYDHNGLFDGEANGIYNGSLCSPEAEALGLCTTELVYVQASVPLIMSGSFANIRFLDPNYQPLDEIDLRGGAIRTVFIEVGDLHHNPMPKGTEVALEMTNCTYLGGSFRVSLSEIKAEVPNTNYSGPLVYMAMLKPTENDGTYGLLRVWVTTPKENASSAFISVADDN